MSGMCRIYDKVFQLSIWFPDVYFICCYSLHYFVAKISTPIFKPGLLSQTYAVDLSPNISDFFSLELKVSPLFHLQTRLMSNTAVL